MINESEIIKSDPLVAVFIKKFKEQLPLQVYEWAGEEDIYFVIPASNPDVGALNIWFDGDEYTVGIGEFFHTHFELYDHSDLPKEQQLLETADKVIRFIDDILSGRIILCVHFYGNKPRGSSVFHEDDPEYCSMTIPVREDSKYNGNEGIKKVLYKWTGSINQVQK